MEEHAMNTDPVLVGVNSVFPNQNSSTAPTVWEEDTDQAAQQGIPCAPGPMLTLTRRSSNLPFLPGGAVNPCPDAVPSCLFVDNLRTGPGVSQRLSASLIAGGIVGGQFIGGIPGSPGFGVVGAGAPGDGVRGIATGATPSGHGVAGVTFSSSVNHAGVRGEANTGAVGVLGESGRGSGIGVRGKGSSQAVRADGGTFGVVAAGTATALDGRGAGAGTFGVVGVGGVAGVWGGNPATGGIGVIGVSGPNFTSGGFTFTPWAGRFDGPVRVGTDLFVNGGLFVTGSPKSSVVSHPDGSQRVLHAVEAPESWFEDVGRGQLRQGIARVEVDPDFALVSQIGDDYHVFITPEGPSNPLYVTDRTSSGFEVREQGEGTSEISFSYRIMTRRTDARYGRLQQIQPPTQEGEKADLPVSAARDIPETPPIPPEAPPPAERKAEEAAAPEPPEDWPHESVPWPPEILRYRSDR
jgi:hypothetical protein